MKKKIWITIGLVLLIAAIVYLGMIISQGVVRVLKEGNVNSGEADPMFAEPTENPTRPPEMDVEEQQPEHLTLDDYVDDVRSPVEKTAAELASEAESLQ